MKHNNKNILDLLNQIGSMLAHSILLFPYSLFLYIRKREFRISECLSLVLNHWSKEDFKHLVGFPLLWQPMASPEIPRNLAAL